ncbi:MAG: C40 family peptidase [Candidatus Kapabacteria bacterium]|nr:C40 family peptidase [Candidatus Kapabacteria bacterium]
MIKGIMFIIRRNILIFLLVPALIFTYSTENLNAKTTKTHKITSSKVKKTSKKAKKNRRNYKPELTRKQAIETIITNSEEISNLAGLESAVQDNTATSTFQEDPEYIELGEDLAELEMEDDVTVDMDAFRMLWLNSVDDEFGDDLTQNGLSKKAIMKNIMEWLGTPYRFGGLTDRGIDCSAFVQKIYLTSNNIHLPRTAQNQFSIGLKINKNQLQFGDLVFFHTRRHAYASHVGIYLGDNLFAHSSSKYGVTVSSLESTYYSNRFIGARRLSVRDIVRLSSAN